MQRLKNENMKLMKQAGKLRDPEWYKEAMKALFVCYTEDKHENCKHHKCAKDYHTPKNLLVTCPFHKEAFRLAVFDLIDQAELFIDREHGRIENNCLEGNFAQTWRTKMKGEPVSHETWQVGTCLFALVTYTIIICLHTHSQQFSSAATWKATEPQCLTSEG